MFALSGNKHLARAVNKYGLSNFAFVVLEVIPNDSKPISSNNNPDLLAMENKYITLLKPVYNKAPLAGNTLGFRHTEETKLKLRRGYSEKRREEIGSLNRGKKLSAITKDLMKQKALERKPFSAETRELISANSAKAKWYTISKLDGSSTVTLRTIAIASNYCGCSGSAKKHLEEL